MLFAPAPPGSTLRDSAERKPSGILSALVFDHGASVSSSFPSRWIAVGPRSSGAGCEAAFRTSPVGCEWKKTKAVIRRGICAWCVAPPSCYWRA